MPGRLAPMAHGGKGSPIDFTRCFQALTGWAPLRWQTQLYTRFAGADIPAACTLPTGLGKTSVIPIWLIALAHADANTPPRRLVYIVNRRTVVDQATDDAKRLLACIYRSGQRDGLKWATDAAMKALGLSETPHVSEEHAPALAALRNRLAELSGNQHAPPLAISTLRGEFADNGEWKENPARAAIIVGTIDMIGSKLLFSGYGDGRYGRAHHAGLIGQDTLIVHDEAHLSPAFSRLLWTVEHEQRIGERENARDRDRSRSIRVMELSATPRDDDETRLIRAEVLARRGGGLFPSNEGEEAEAKLFDDPLVKQRRKAKKRLTFVGVQEGGKGDAAFVGKVADQALAHESDGCRVLVYVRSPKAAQDVRDAIVKRLIGTANKSGDADAEAAATARVGLLTGTIRGFERDELARSDLFRAFKSDPDRPPRLDHTVYLVSTSAGEVGADWDADHIVCDLTTLDSMAQRFGRVNRLGGGRRIAHIAVVQQPIGDKDPLADQVAATAQVLRTLPPNGKSDSNEDASFNASPAALSALFGTKPAPDAFSPSPTILPATDILFDSWSLTAIVEMPGRPEVEPYLHGVAEWEPPETHVAWRADIADLARAGGKDECGSDIPASQKDLERVFEVFPLRSAELLRERTDRALEQLQAIAARAPDQRCVLLKHGTPRWTTLGQVAPEDFDRKRIASSPLTNANVVLPVEVGGLKDGGLKGDEEAPADPKALDVAEALKSGRVDRQRVYIGGGSEGEASNGTPMLGTELLGGTVTRHIVRLSAESDEDEEDAAGVIEYRVLKGEELEPGERIGLDEHNAAVAAAAARIGNALALESKFASALELAGKHHDTGKGRDVWQLFARNLPHRPPPHPGGPIAKSDRYGHWKILAGYRHEFGSLLDAAIGPVGGTPPSEIAGHSERDLILHLIAAHHGWARPHFEPEHSDPRPRPTADSDRAAVESVQRFARLQQRFGRWGLAYLESLLRAADSAASAAPSAPAAERKPGL